MLCGSVSAALSSKRSVRPFASKPPPASDISITRWPPGPTSAMSRSPGNEWLNSTRVTVTRLTVPARPVTLMVAGYGNAGWASSRKMDSSEANAPGSTTVLTTRAVLLFGRKSRRSEKTLNEFVTRPEAVRPAVSVMVAEAERLSCPSAQVSVPLVKVQPPCDAVALT